MTTRQPTASVPPPGVDYDRKWFVMAAIAMGVFLGTIDGSIVNAALPTLVDDLGTTFPAVQWVVLGYLLTQATLTMMVGRLGDMLGKKRIYTAGFGLFTVASVMCGIAPSIHWLIGFRVLQGVGSAMIFALGFAIVTESFPPSERGRALGISGSIVSVGIAIGPAVGGLLIDALSWHWIFLVNLPVGIIGTWTAHRFVPDVPAKGGQRFDRIGAAVFFVALLGVMLGLTLGQERGFGDGVVVALIALGLVATAAFIVIERRVEHPMLDLKLFRNRLLSVNLITGWLTFISIAGMLILIPFYLQNVLGYGLREMGFLLAVPAVALGVVAPASGALSDKIGPRPVTVTGLVILLAGYLFASRLNADSTVVNYVAAMIPIGVGMGIFQSPNNSAIMGSVPQERLGVTSGLLTITRITGQLVGIAVLGTIWATVVSRTASPGVDPTTASPAAQAAGLQATMLVVCVLIAVALVLATWGLILHRRK